MKISLCIIAKDENNYINEWIQHYNRIGVTDIYIYDNNDINNMSLYALVKDYDNVKIIDVRGKEKIQKSIYTYHYNKYKSVYDWLLFLDGDEFIQLDIKYNTLEQFLSQPKFNKYQGIKLCWKYFDDNNIIKPSTYSISQYTHYNDCIDENIQCKTIYRGAIESIEYTYSVHCDTTHNLKICNALGQQEISASRFILNKIPIHSECWINHYRYKSIHEYVTIKMKRGYPNQTLEHAQKYKLTLDNFFKANIYTIEKENYAKTLLK